jgi:exonuclease SbcD
MKILHTGDWHLGKIVNQVYMTADQSYILEELCKIIDEVKPDVIVISGDIYDRAVPPVDAVELLDSVLSIILLEKHIPIIATAGNHDSPDRIAFGSNILKNNGLNIEGKLKKDIRKVVLIDEFGAVNFYLVPYADPMEVRSIFENEDIHSQNDAFRAILDKIKENINREERNVLVCHGYIRGVAELERSDSERPLSIGGSEYVDAAMFSEFEYTALGHLHGAQKVTDNSIRYSGSILKYSFSEVKQNKCAVLVELGEKGTRPVVKLKPLKPIREMRIIKGELKEIIKAAENEKSNSQDYIKAILTDEGELIDPMNKLRTVYPNVLELIREEKNKRSDEAKTSAGEGYKNKSKIELFKSFYENISGTEFTMDKEDIVLEVINKVEKEERG